MSIPFTDRIATLRVKPSLPDHRDQWLFATAPTAALPKQADLGSGVIVPIKDQGRQGSCTGHGYASMMEALELIHGMPHVDLSRAYIYARERLLENDLDQDAGAQPADGCRTLSHYGVCEESQMPYSDQIFAVAPTATEDQQAAKHKTLRYARLANSRAAQEQTVMRRPVGFGIAVYESYESVGADGVLPMPQPGEKMLGGHWVFGNAKGYVTDASLPGGGGFWTQQSWGLGFAKSGYLLMPNAYIDNPSYCFEVRVIWR